MAGSFGLTALMEAVNSKEQTDDTSNLMGSVADDNIKQLVLDREVADEVLSHEKIQKFVDTIPESSEGDDAYKKREIKDSTLEALDVLTEHLVMEGVI